MVIGPLTDYGDIPLSEESDSLPHKSVYNVKAYGAVGDGPSGTDDTAAFQLAIDAAETAGNGTVYIPPGSYTIVGTIDMKQGVSLVGEGRAHPTDILTSTTLHHEPTAANTDMFDFDFTIVTEESSARRHAIVEGFALWGDNSTNSRYGFKMVRPYGLVCRNISISRFTDGINLESGINNSFHNVFIQNCTQCVRLMVEADWGRTTTTNWYDCYFSGGGTGNGQIGDWGLVCESAGTIAIGFVNCIFESFSEGAMKVFKDNGVYCYNLYVENVPRLEGAKSIFRLGKDGAGTGVRFNIFGGFIKGHVPVDGDAATPPVGSSMIDADSTAQVYVTGCEMWYFEDAVESTANTNNVVLENNAYFTGVTTTRDSVNRRALTIDSDDASGAFKVRSGDGSTYAFIANPAGEFNILYQKLRTESSVGACIQTLQATNTYPPYSFLDDLNSGFSRAATSQPCIVANSTEVARFAESTTTIYSTSGLSITGSQCILANATNPYYLVADTTNNVHGILRATDTIAYVGSNTAHPFSLYAGGSECIQFSNTDQVGTLRADLKSDESRGPLLKNIISSSVAPGFTFVGDENTGFSSSGIDIASIITGGTELVKCDGPSLLVTMSAGLTVTGLITAANTDITGDLACNTNTFVVDASEDAVAIGTTSVANNGDNSLTLFEATAEAASVAVQHVVLQGKDAGAYAKLQIHNANHTIELYQQAHIADPSGGATQDAEARTAINSILSILENLGLLATS